RAGTRRPPPYRRGRHRRDGRAGFSLRIGRSHPQHLFRVAADKRGARFLVKAVDRGDVADRIVVRHVEGIVSAHDDVVDSEGTDQRYQLYRGEDDGVDIDLLQIASWRFWQIGVTVRARAPGVVDASGVGAKIAAAMHGEDLQIGMTLKHAVKD